MTEGAAQKFDLAKEISNLEAFLADKPDDYKCAMPVPQLRTIARALRLASAWLRAYDEYIDGDLLDCTDYVERFRRALEGSPE